MGNDMRQRYEGAKMIARQLKGVEGRLKEYKMREMKSVNEEVTKKGRRGGGGMGFESFGLFGREKERDFQHAGLPELQSSKTGLAWPR
jgi:hypothetical protein